MAGILNILVAEDDPMMREAMAAVLRGVKIPHLSIRVMAVSNGAQVVSAFRGGGVDLCFLDIEMEGKSGLEALKEVRRTTPSAYIVMVSGHSSPENVREAIGAGAKGFVVKPFMPERIIHVVEHYVYQKGMPVNYTTQQ